MIAQVSSTEELRALLPMARKFTSQDNVIPGLDEERWVRNWSSRIEHDPGSAIFYQTNGSPEPVGAIGCYTFKSGLDGVLEAKEAFWFTDPERRGGGLELLGKFEGWAKERGAKRLWMVRLDGIRERALDRLYARRGYRPIERAFCMEID